MTTEEADKLEELAMLDGPIEWVPVGRADLQELLSAWRGQRAMKDEAKHAPLDNDEVADDDLRNMTKIESTWE